MNKIRINFSLTEEAHALLRSLADRRGLSMNALLEILIREETNRQAKKSAKPDAGKDDAA